MILFASILYMGPSSCTEPFPIKTLELEQLLVAEGTITNEFRHHVIKLSRTTPLETFRRNIETEATVWITDSEGNIESFHLDPQTGDYISAREFSAIPGLSYSLEIITKDNQHYISQEVTLPPAVGIARVYTEQISEGNKEGVDVYVDSELASESVQYFRYEYEETYKIVVPKPSNWSWSARDYDFRSGFYEIDLTRRIPETFCYSSNASKGLMQTSTAGFENKQVVHFPLHYIYQGNPILRERYSILAKQYVQSLEAHTFYQTLADLGNSEGVLSQGQPGFLPGNITSLTNPNEKVMGFFEASSVTTKRIYFNYKDFTFTFPPYFNECERIKTMPTTFLINKLENENYQIQDYEEDGPIKVYHIYKEICTDCTTFSSNVKPDFWEE